MNKTALEKLIAKGKWRYVFIYGVLGWGISAAVLYSAFQHFFGAPDFINQLSSAMIIFPPMGIIFGLVMWQRINNDYRNSKNK